jgi:Lar family restriction alleviation protein
MKRNKLDPCPFCGGKNLEPTTFDIQDREGYPTHIRCADCGATGPWVYVPKRDGISDELIEVWNERTTLSFGE